MSVEDRGSIIVRFLAVALKMFQVASLLSESCLGYACGSYVFFSITLRNVI